MAARLTKLEMIMGMAYVARMRSSCLRRAVGAVIVDKQWRVLSTGYNGPPKGYAHCTEEPCSGATAKSGTELDACNAIHAEQNAIGSCADISRAWRIVVTTQPCMACTKQLLTTPIKYIDYGDSYPYGQAQEELWLAAGRHINGIDSVSDVLARLDMDGTEHLAKYRAWHNLPRYGNP